MRTSKLPMFVLLASASAVLLLGVACGGGNKEDAKAPSGAASASSAPTPSDTAAGGGAGPAGGDSTGATTTTTNLPDGGELQGAKLSSSSRQEIETKGDAGPKGGKTDEPGRRRDDLKAIIGAHRDEARACYDKAVKDHPGMQGDLDVKWTIDPDGNVQDPSVDQQKSAIHDEGVAKCVIDVIKKIKFAPSAKGFETHAHYPFNFMPRNTPPGKKDAGA